MLRISRKYSLIRIETDDNTSRPNPLNVASLENKIMNTVLPR